MKADGLPYAVRYSTIRVIATKQPRHRTTDRLRIPGACTRTRCNPVGARGNTRSATSAGESEGESVVTVSAMRLRVQSRAGNTTKGEHGERPQHPSSSARPSAMASAVTGAELTEWPRLPVPVIDREGEGCHRELKISGSTRPTKK